MLKMPIGALVAGTACRVSVEVRAATAAPTHPAVMYRVSIRVEGAAAA
jgi:hypothetical protein